MAPYKVLVVDDSAFMRKIFSDLIEKDPSFQVVDTAVNGREAVEKALGLKPDIVTMDVEMPEMNGLEALKLIMAKHPMPVIMLSGINEEGMKETIMALESGAFDFIRKPSLTYSQHIDQVRDALLEQLKAAMAARERRAAFQAEEKKRKRQAGSDRPFVSPATAIPEPKKNKYEPIKRPELFSPKPEVPLEKPERRMKAKKTNPSLPPAVTVEETAAAREYAAAQARTDETDKQPEKRLAFDDLVAIGCSTGGPRALKAVLEKLPADLPAPVVIVQHMPPNFTRSLAQRLNSFSPLEVMEAEDGMKLRAGCAYVAPGGKHMRVVKEADGGLALSLSEDQPVNGHRPSVDTLFESLLPLASLRRHAVLMTGMGSDGAKMMKRLYDSGVKSTFAESEETCVVYGMPRSAVELDCVSHLLPLHQIAAGVVRAVSNGK
ncbi:MULTISPECIES: protein-glutamate methylesterase/protein-glutamine glutaminase [Paenibacillus]|uniref:Protein-glutamate methylesterase/protein-glutamine glutaminase n=1 Tax=Paenibacillus albilobatus TaxID=2716884 RepID=A0A920CB08_9BACL|nr:MULTISPECIES: chemotaxis response regulator protein-glutamate methylesterase [Paenibacillus]GIO29982.1 chemotaxis response regulator protein-glutamate methylesterase 3 [Paenibacillus albilobatus]